MTQNGVIPLAECIADCGGYWAGHNAHFIQAKKVGQSPWGWRDAIVTGLSGLDVQLPYVGVVGKPLLWHHRRGLAEHLSIGEPVRLHERYFVLGTRSGWFSVLVRDGLGAVREPQEPSLWQAKSSLGIVDLATGIALPTDRRNEA